MRRTLAFAAAALLLAALAPRGAHAFGVKDVVAMHRDGIADSLIVEKIEHSGTRFDLSARDLHDLKAAGVPDPVVVAMLRTEDDDRAPIVYDDRWWPYGPGWALGLDLGFYGPLGRVYAPLFVGPRFGPRFRGGFGFRGRWGGSVRFRSG